MHSYAVSKAIASLVAHLFVTSFIKLPHVAHFCALIFHLITLTLIIINLYDYILFPFIMYQDMKKIDTLPRLLIIFDNCF